MRQSVAMFNSWPNVEFVPCIRTDWGNFSLVDATLKAMEAVRNSGQQYDRIILLSGQDYPIKSTADINRFFKSSKYSVFMDHIELPDYTKWSNGGSYRFNKYFFGFSFIHKYSAKAINFLSTYIKMLRRKLKTEMQHFYGSQWWIIDGYTLNYILNFVQKNPQYRSFHQHTFAPDELFFQTIILNSKDERIYNCLLNNNLRFMKWRKIRAHTRRF